MNELAYAAGHHKYYNVWSRIQLNLFLNLWPQIYFNSIEHKNVVSVNFVNIKGIWQLGDFFLCTIWAHKLVEDRDLHKILAKLTDEYVFIYSTSTSTCICMHNEIICSSDQLISNLFWSRVPLSTCLMFYLKKFFFFE